METILDLKIALSNRWIRCTQNHIGILPIMLCVVPSFQLENFRFCRLLHIFGKGLL
jgi:hypothetical protein